MKAFVFHHAGRVFTAHAPTAAEAKRHARASLNVRGGRWEPRRGRSMFLVQPAGVPHYDWRPVAAGRL